jgi:TetR/AcrR family transcriptional regulator
MPILHASRNRGRRHAADGVTREAILAAAKTIFAGAGLAGARTEAIAAAAGVNKALLYYYFKSKERLYVAVLEDEFRGFSEEAIGLLSGPGSPRSILLRFVGLHFDAISRKQRFAPLHQQFMMSGARSMAALVQKYAIPRSRALGRLLDRGIRAGEFRRVDLRHAAISITALVVFYFSIGPVLRLVAEGDPYGEAELRRRRQEVLDFVRYSLFTKPEAPVS